MSSNSEPQVLLVGAGPTGLLLAAELERRDVPCLLIDALDAPRNWDRATVVHARTMEIFESLGLADQLLDQGVQVHAAVFRSNGETLARLEFGLAGSRYGDVGISEEVTESVLTRFLEEQGGRVTRSTRLVSLRASPDGVEATLERDGERSEVSVAWVVGCDGLHSVVREFAGIDFPGTDIEAPWAVFDATTEPWDDEYDVTHAQLDRPPVILTSLPNRRWRVYLRPTAPESDLVAEATEVVRRYWPDVTFTDVENPTRFHCHSRVAERFRADRVFLAGDAAHVCTPSEGHGMNTGLQDAFNLGWKLAHVCRGESGPALLDSYDVERRPVAMRVAASGDDTEAGQALTALEERAARDSGIRTTFGELESAHHEAVAHAEIDRSYADSPVVSGTANERLAPGQRLPDTTPVVPAGGSPCPLHELTHRAGHTLLVLGGPEATAEEVGAAVDAVEAAQVSSPHVGAVLGFCVGGEPPLGRIDTAVADQLGIEKVTVLAIRPDRYVGLRDDAANPAAVTAYLESLSA